MKKRITASKLTGSSEPHKTRGGLWNRYYRGSTKSKLQEHEIQEAVKDFDSNCSKNYETYKAPDGFVNTFRKTRVSAYDKKKNVWIRTVDIRGREINYFYPTVGKTYFIAVDFFNYDYFNTGEDKYKAYKGRNCSSCLKEEYDKLKKGYWTLLSKKELYFYDTRFQYLLWTKSSRPIKKRKKGLIKK